MMSNDVVTNTPSVVPSLKNMSVAEIAALTGQEVSSNESQSLPRFAINHGEEDNEGRSIPRGEFSLKLPMQRKLIYEYFLGCLPTVGGMQSRELLVAKLYRHQI